MYQSIIDYAQSQRQELRRQAAIYSPLKIHHGPRLRLSPRIRETAAQSLIDLGTHLKAEAPSPPLAFIKSQQNSWHSH